MAWIVENRRTQVVERRETPYLTDDMKIDLATTYFPRYPTKRAVLLPALHAVQHEYGWIIEIVIVDTRLGGVLLCGVVGGLIVGQRRGACIGQAAGRIEAHEVGAARPIQLHDQPVSAGGQEDRQQNLQHQQHAAPGHHRLLRETKNSAEATHRCDNQNRFRCIICWRM